MGNRLGNRASSSFENEVFDIYATIVLDGSSNVVGYAPTLSVPIPGSNPYTRAIGMQKSIGAAGSIITQPHTATGVYVFTLDEPWLALNNSGYQLYDQGAVAAINGFIDANVGGNQNGSIFPGNNTALAAQTIRVRFRNTSGTLTDPQASTSFSIWLNLKRTGV